MHSKSAAERIGASVDRLEKLFSMLYSDTFALMKDTYQDMRRHAWPEGVNVGDKVIAEAEKKTDEKLSMLKLTLANQLDRVLDKQTKTEAEFAKVKDDVRQLVDRAILESRRAEGEAREEVIRKHIVEQIKSLAKMGECVTAGKIVTELEPRFNFRDILQELERMKEEGVISYEGKKFRPGTEIRLEKS